VIITRQAPDLWPASPTQVASMLEDVEQIDGTCHGLWFHASLAFGVT
jgi:hypothetical protein